MARYALQGRKINIKSTLLLKRAFVVLEYIGKLYLISDSDGNGNYVLVFEDHDLALGEYEVVIHFSILLLRCERRRGSAVVIGCGDERERLFVCRDGIKSTEVLVEGEGNGSNRFVSVEDSNGDLVVIVCGIYACYRDRAVLHVILNGLIVYKNGVTEGDRYLIAICQLAFVYVKLCACGM